MDLHPQLKDWLHLVRDMELVVQGCRELVASENMVWFPLDVSRTGGVTAPELCTFLVAVSSEYCAKAEVAGASGVFYAWVDDFAGQLRCSFTNVGDPNDLPFGARLNVSTRPDVIAEAAVKQPLLEEASRSEFRDVDWSEPNDVEKGEYLLNVYVSPVGAGF